MKVLCWRQLLTVIFISSTFAGATGPVKIVKPFPRNVFELEGTPASVTCVADGGPDKVQFVRRNHAGTFLKLTNESRVYTIVKAEGGRTVFTLYFETLMISDDSAERRYECWAHQPEDKDDHWRSSAKHGFSINVISKTSLPTLLPKYPVVYKKSLGESLRLDCNITVSEQTFDIKAYSAHWTRNQEIIETVYAENGSFNRTLKPLTFNKISSKNGGNYSCLLQTRMREIRPLNFSGGTHVVLVKVKMTETYQEVYVTEGKNVTLQCNAEGYPVRVSWKKIIGESEVDFASVPKLSMVSRFYKDCETCNHKVRLHGVTKDLGGTYICRAANSLGSGQQIFILFVKEKVKIVSPYPRNLYIVEGDAATVTCIARGTPDKVQFVRRNEFGRFSELSNTSQIYTTARREGARTIFTLHFERSVLEDDSAIRRYECWAHQPGDTTKHWHSSAKHGFSINVIARKFVPKISPERGIIYEKQFGDSLTLNCNMTVPKQTFDVRAEAVHWLRNNKILTTVYAEEGQFKRPLEPLYVSNISARDGGNYSCLMETKLRGVKPLTIRSGTSTVYVEIMIRREEQRLHVFKGQNITLQCSAEGYPLHVEWKKVIGGLEIDVAKIPEISRNARFNQDCDYCQHELELHNVTELFGGKYRCRANNSVSSGRQQFTLLVTDAFTSSSLGTTANTSVFLLLLVLLENI